MYVCNMKLNRVCKYVHIVNIGLRTSQNLKYELVMKFFN